MNSLRYQAEGYLPSRQARGPSSGRGAGGTRPQRPALVVPHPFRPAFCAAPTSTRPLIRFRPQGAHAQLHECFDSSGLEGTSVARVGSAPPSEGCLYGEPWKRGRAGAPPGPWLARKQVSRRVGLSGYRVSTLPAQNKAAHARAQQCLRSSLGLAPGYSHLLGNSGET